MGYRPSPKILFLFSQMVNAAAQIAAHRVRLVWLPTKVSIDRVPVTVTRDELWCLHHSRLLTKAYLVALARLQCEPDDKFIPQPTAQIGQSTSSTKQVTPSTRRSNPPSGPTQSGSRSPTPDDRPSADGCSGSWHTDRSQQGAQLTPSQSWNDFKRTNGNVIPKSVITSQPW